MSKEPESKDSAEPERKRRGGLRVPSDKVPRRAPSEGDVTAPVPEAVGLAASVSESFGVAGNGATDEDTSAAGDEMDTVVSETTQPDNPLINAAEAAKAKAAATSTPIEENKAEESAKKPPAVPAVKPVAKVPPVSVNFSKPPAKRINRADTSPGFVPPGRSAIVRPPGMEADDEEDESDEIDDEDETGDSVDIDIDEGDEDDEETINTPVPETGEAPPMPAAPEAAVAPPMPAAPEAAVAPPMPAAPEAAVAPPVAMAPEAAKPAAEAAPPVKAEPPAPPSASAKQDSATSPASIDSADEVADSKAKSTEQSVDAKTERADTADDDQASKVASADEAATSKKDEGKKKPRFTRALTMALNESDLEEVRAQTAKINAATPVEDASPIDSGDVIAEHDMEEISEEPAATEELAAVVKKKRAETAEPPPPPPPAQKASPPKEPAKAPAPKALSPEEAKRRKKKPWFEELFDEDYLRTLPFLTPQATQFEANFVMESLGVEAGAQILDVGCGYGRHAMELAARGYHLVGLDSSLPLLLRGADEAQRRGLTINFVHGDMREMTYESQFDGAYCLFSTFGYFDDETNKRTAQNIAKALKPGARLVVEVLNRDYLVADLPSRVWWEGDGCVVLEEVEFNYFSSRIVSSRSVVFDDGRQLEHEISLRSFSLHELGKFLHSVGFRVLEISGSMSTRGRFFGSHSRDIVVVAERRATSADDS